MKRTLTNSTRMVILVEDDTGNVAQLIATITALVALLVSFSRFVAEVALFVSDIVEASRWTLMVFDIGFRAVMWGFLGVRL